MWLAPLRWALSPTGPPGLTLPHNTLVLAGFCERGDWGPRVSTEGVQAGVTHLLPEMPRRHQKGGAQSPWLLLIKPRSTAAGVVAAPDLHLSPTHSVVSTPGRGEVS